MRTLIIGAGGISRVHADALAKLGVEVVGVYDINADNARRTAELCGSRPVKELGEVLEHTDAVHLLTPPSKRVEYACLAMNAGKHILCEKPIASDLEDARTKLDCAEKNGVIFMMAFNMRFRNGYKRLKEIVDSGDLGNPVNVFSYRHGAGSGFGGRQLSASWRTDPALACGISVESLSHDIDFIRSLAGEFSLVSAVTNASVPSLPMFDNSAGVAFVMSNGAIGYINASWASHIGKSTRGFIGDKGTAILQGRDQWDFTELRYKTGVDEREQIEFIGDYFSHTDSYYKENQYFKQCVENGLRPVTTGTDGIKALAVSKAILKSVNENRAITIMQ